MFYHLENNWMNWYYNDDLDKKTRTNSEDQFKVKIIPYSGIVEDARTECIKACQSIRDTYPNEKFSIMFSGGSESEMLVRSFVEAKIPFEIFIGRYENDLNLYDVSHAVIACESMGLPYKIIDLNIKNFFENDAIDYSIKSQIIVPPLLVQLPLCDAVDGIPIMGGGECIVHRIDCNYSNKGEWIFEEWEDNWGWTKYFHNVQRPAIPEWCRWSPSQFLSWTKLNWFKQLTNDKFIGKLGITSTKIHGYREAWPEILIKKKSYGMEPMAPLLLELAEELMKVHNNESFGGLRFFQNIDTDHPIKEGKFVKNLQYAEVTNFLKNFTNPCL